MLNLTLACLALAAPQAGPSSVEAALERFERDHGRGWRLDLDEGTGFAEFLGGKSAALSFVPRDDAEWFVLAREALAGAAELFGIEPSTLREQRVLLLPLGMTGGSDKWTVRFAQEVRGVPVEEGAVNVLFDARGRLLSVQAHALPGIAALDVRPALAADEAVRIAREAFAQGARLDGELQSPPRLVIAQLEQGGERRGALAWRVEVGRAPGGEPEAWAYHVDARDGSVLARTTLIHHLDVSGVLRTRATQGNAPDGALNPPTEQPLPYTTVSSGAVTTVTDAWGNFTLPGVTAPASVTVGFDGTFNNVNNVAGPDHVVTFQANSASGNVLVLNAPSSAEVTAQANVAVEIVRMRDWIRGVNPLDGNADFVHTAFVNLAQTCNAYYSGGAINFFAAGGGCANTAYSTVIGHEDGHWLNVIYGTGNGGDGIGEGNADVFAMFLYDTQLIGRDFCGPGCHIRSGDNLRQFCGDCCPACHGGVHADGEVWMGALWKLRSNLNQTLGNAAGDALADALFLGWMNAYNQTQIRSVNELQWLTLDDDDGDLDSGTPHFAQIDGAFRQQGFPGVTLRPVHIGTVTELGDTSDVVGPYAVEALVFANTSQGLASVELVHRTHLGAWVSVPMNPRGGAQWAADIPGQPGAKIYYYVRAVEGGGQSIEFPAAGAAAPLFFSVGPTTTVFADRFEQDLGWSVVDVAAVSGSWVRGEPFGTILGQRTPQPNDDSPDPGSLCFFTGQGSLATVPDEADVDGGPTTLVSPPIDLAGQTAEIEYSYWMFSSGIADDVLTVELSNDGVQWTVARTHPAGDGWRSGRVDVSTHIVPGATTRVRFSVADSPSNTITEAALDNVRVRVLGTAACAMPQVFCTPKVNSLLCVPAMASSGFPSVGGSSPFVLSASSLLNNRSGLLFYGYGSASKAFSGGTLCCRTPVRRTALQSTGGNPTGNDCTGSLTFDMNAWLRSGADANLTVGTAVAAQYYYRDPQDAQGVGLSDAVSFVVCP